MSSSSTIKTTVRLPADLHWQFQGERAKRRLSNEKAIAEAFAFWIAHPQQLDRRPNKKSRSNLHPTSPHERECIEILLHILRDSDDPARATAVQAVLEALSSPRWEEHAKQTRPGLSSTGPDNFEKRVEQLHQRTKDARRSAERSRLSGSRVGGTKT
jgi:hypothetical protein